MQLFYGTEIEDGIMILSEQESNHCVKVLRMKTGDPVEMTDGKGHLYKGIVELAHPKHSTLEIKETQLIPPPPIGFHLYVSILKHSDRIEWMLEKCIELGLSSFTPLISHRTEKRNIRMDRLEAIALSAMKQSLKAWLPVIHPPVSFVKAVEGDHSETRLVAHCIDDIQRDPITQIQSGRSCSIFIGPEGDFTREEIKFAMEKKLTGISLGSSRLRTETAALAACNWMYWINTKAQG